MPSNIDIRKEWEKTKKQLIKFSKESAEIAKKGEKELIKFTEQGKLHIDATAVNLRREKLYYQIGKEYIKAKNPAKISATLNKLIEEYHLIEKQQKSLKGKINSAKKTKKTAKKTSKK